MQYIIYNIISQHLFNILSENNLLTTTYVFLPLI